MNAIEVGRRLVALSNEGRDDAALSELYADEIVSVEAQGGDEGTFNGLEAVKAKHEWWNASFEVHSAEACGPYTGARDDQFVVRFNIDVTPTEAGSERQQMEEVGIFTVAGGRIVREEYLPLST